MNNEGSTKGSDKTFEAWTTCSMVEKSFVPLKDFLVYVYRTEDMVEIFMKLYSITINRVQCHAYGHLFRRERTELFYLRSYIILFCLRVVFGKAKGMIVIVLIRR